ncbi:MAG: precorrin-3B C(17)-methyltransferase [Deferrisomatales bacterium]|nr:precorrin-3B C(17)-methyltransferase [Deferrisomatales bacterium]
MLFVVGIGPGGRPHMTGRALEAIAAAEVVVGYTLYIELLGDLLDGKPVVSTGMTREVDRCGEAVRLALQGLDVAVVSTGDPGVYGMAGLVLELLADADPEGQVEVELVPGVSAVHAAASLLGAPLMTDFAVISLSDLLTPWATIQRRLEAAAAGDFVVALYNPRSRKRVAHLEEACAILTRHRPGTTPAGIVRNALREGQQVELTTLAEVPGREVDMMSVVIVGNGSTRLLRSRLVTPRGYRIGGRKPST